MNNDGTLSPRPWGGFRNLYSEPGVHMKTLHVSAGKKLSLQWHRYRQELWLLLSGDAQVTVGPDIGSLEEIEMEIGVVYRIPQGSLHRLGSRGGASVAEISFGEFDEEDIVRIADDYGRVAS